MKVLSLKGLLMAILLSLSLNPQANAQSPAPADPAPLVEMIEEREELSARDGTTREYVRKYRVENPGPVDKPIEYERKVVEEADGLNYDAALSA
jgi:hypothetical protein